MIELLEVQGLKFHYWLSVLHLHISFLGAWIVLAISEKYSDLTNPHKEETQNPGQASAQNWINGKNPWQEGNNSPAPHLTGDYKYSTGKAGAIKTMDCLVNNHL